MTDVNILLSTKRYRKKVMTNVITKVKCENVSSQMRERMVTDETVENILSYTQWIIENLPKSSTKTLTQV